MARSLSVGGPIDSDPTRLRSACAKNRIFARVIEILEQNVPLKLCDRANQVDPSATGQQDQTNVQMLRCSSKMRVIGRFDVFLTPLVPSFLDNDPPEVGSPHNVYYLKPDWITPNSFVRYLAGLSGQEANTKGLTEARRYPTQAGKNVPTII